VVRTIMALLLGGWLLGTLLMAGVATENFLMVDRLLRSPASADFQKDVAALPPGEARLMLRYLSSELNRFYFRVWEAIELLLSGTLLVLAAAGLKSRKLTLGISLILAISLVMVFYLTPELVEVGRRLDFLPRQPPPPELAHFGRLHATYSILDLGKLLLGLWVVVALVRHPAPS